MEYVDDIIRKEKISYREKGVSSILLFRWGKEGYEQMRRFLAAVIICPHGLNCFYCDYGEKHVDGYFNNKPFRFLGADHTWDRRKKGMLLSVKAT